VDIHADFTAAAGQRLQAAGITNTQLATGEAVNSWQPQGAFDVVIVTGAVYRIPDRFLGWLKPGGRLLAIRGESPVQQVVLLTKEGNDRFQEESVLETDLPYLTNAEPPRRFVF
jgi:protein-L-isoaspartate(D-aspartate) O-methyltransferase